jgi:hypothetical protein
MTKTSYAVQWFDGDKWRTTYGYRGDTLTQGISELEMHIATFPEVEARLVELETTTTIQDVILTAPEAT